MKKVIPVIAVIAAALLLCAACGKSSAESDEESANGVKRVISYSANDLAIYTVDDTEGSLMPSKFITMLGVDPSTVEPSDDETLAQIQQFIETETMEISEGDMENPGKTVKKNIVRYFSYMGSRTPVTNVKGITTTGIMPEDDNCSSVDDVIEAYGIDKDNEEYIDNESEDGSYVIKLNFKDLDTDEGTLERIVTQKGSEVNEAEVRYALRFTIRNDHVHGIDAYMYF